MPDTNEQFPGPGASDDAVQTASTTSALLAVLNQQTELLKSQEALIREQAANQALILDQMHTLTKITEKYANASTKYDEKLEYLTHAALAPTLDAVWNFLSENQLGLEATLERLAKTDDSLARFGDGEFQLMLSPWRNLAFQKNSFELIAALESTVASSFDSLMIGLPQFMRNPIYLKVWPKIWGRLSTLLDHTRTYANAHVSRPLAFKFLGDTAVELWREVWRGKSLTIITGKGSRFEVVSELFETSTSIDRIDSTPVNAFADIDRIMGLVGERDSDIFIVSMGPAGTVLSHQIAATGRRALDIGHLSAAYLNVMQGEVLPERTPLVR